ncbi:MAG: hypothetical protein OEW52_13745, partial [Thermoleophilia bacterium]|nr:hypothetical protein [Thermoleophilia bacterium]
MGTGPTARRRHRRRLLEIGFVLATFSAAGLVAAGIVSGADQPSISSDRADYAPGAAVALSGSGWQAGEVVHVVVDDDQSDAWSHTADLTAAADGTVSDSLTLPDVAGSYTITATAPSGSASGTFTVTAPAPPPPPPPPPPPSGPAISSDEADYALGATVALSGSGWQAAESVHVVVDDDQSNAWTHDVDLTAAADGTVSDSLTLPDVAGTYTITATATSGTASATFTATAAAPPPPTPPVWPEAKEPYLVKFASGTSTETQAAVLAAAGAESQSYIRALRIHGVLLPGGASKQASLNVLGSSPSVSRVEPDREREAGGTPNDS